MPALSPTFTAPSTPPPLFFSACPLPWIYPRDSPTHPHSRAQVSPFISSHSFWPPRHPSKGHRFHTTSPSHYLSLCRPSCLSRLLSPNPSKTQKTRSDKGKRRSPPDRSFLPTYLPPSSAPVDPLLPSQSFTIAKTEWSSADLTGRFPVRSYDGYEYVLVVIHHG
jgi:hypothetical protein